MPIMCLNIEYLSDQSFCVFIMGVGDEKHILSFSGIERLERIDLQWLEVIKTNFGYQNIF